MLSAHEHFMMRCLQLAENGRGAVSPNPLVGSVLVKNDQIVGEGFHTAFGKPHAEVEAINACTKRNPSLDLTECVLYVNLEPCSHHGKTPPCTDLIIDRGIKTVVIGTLDPNPVVSGRGIDKLEKAGIQTVTGILEKECTELNKRFILFHQQKRPYVILKWAQTADGFISHANPANREQNLITGMEANRLVHQWRSEEQAILVGAGTVIKDNPRLNVRHWSGKNPTRIVISDGRKLSDHFAIYNEEAQTIIIDESIYRDEPGDPLKRILDTLYERNIQSILVEGGAHTLKRFIESGCWDEARVFISPKRFWEGLSAPILKCEAKESLHVGDDWLQVFHNFKPAS